jgi:hypothetical protein
MPPDPRRSEQSRLRPLLIKPAIDRRLLAQVDRMAADSQNSAFLLGQPADQRRTDHAAMAGDEYAPSAERKECRGAMRSVASRCGGASGRVGKPGLGHGPLAPRKVDVVPDRHLDQLCEGNPRLPAKNATRLGRIAAQRIDLGQPKIAAIDLDVMPPAVGRWSSNARSPSHLAECPPPEAPDGACAVGGPLARPSAWPEAQGVVDPTPRAIPGRADPGTLITVEEVPNSPMIA